MRFLPFPGRHGTFRLRLLMLAMLASPTTVGWGQQTQRIGDFPDFAPRQNVQSVPSPSPTPVQTAPYQAAPFQAAPAPQQIVAESVAVPRSPVATSPAPQAANAVQPASASSEVARSGLSIAGIDARKAELAESTNLAVELRQQIIDQYTRAGERLQEANLLANQTETLRAEAAAVPQETERLQAVGGSQNDNTVLPQSIDRLTADDIRTTLRSIETSLGESRGRLQATAAEIERRATRLRELPELLSQARQKLEDTQRQLAAAPADGESPEMTTARRTRLEAVAQLRQREIDFFQQEARTYVDATRVMSLRRDAADRAIKQAQRHLAHYQRLLADREKADAEHQAKEARRAAINAHPAVREAARINSELADANSSLVAVQDQTRDDLVKAEAAFDDYSAQYRDIRNRAEAAQYSQAIGMMLRNQRALLPDAEFYRERERRRQKESSSLNLRLLEWENERRKILDVDAVAESNLKAVSDGLGLIETIDVRAELQTVFSARLSLYEELITNGKKHLTSLSSLGAAEEKVAKVIDEQASFISEHILWVRSTAPLSLSLVSPMATAVADLISIKTWMGVWNHLVSDIKTHPIFEVLIIPALWLIVIRAKLRRKLESLAQEAQRSSATGFTPTLNAAAVTLLMSLPIPSLIALFGWRLTSVAAVGEFAHALGVASLICSLTLLVLEFIRNACQGNGLGEAHFAWDSETTGAIRRATWLAKICCIPARFICVVAETTDDQLMISTVGRVALIIELLAVSTIVFELLRPASPLVRSIRTNGQSSWAKNTYKIWATVLVLLPAVLAFVSAIGFHYTATRLSARTAATWAVIALMVGLRASALRWLLVVYRRFAIRRSREKRAAMQAQQSVTDTGAANVVPDSSLELRLTDVNDQAQSLIRIATTVIGAVLMTLIWHEILPALGYLNRFEFWDNSLQPINEYGVRPRVTLVDLFFGGACMTITVLACKNLPGLLDISVFQRLPLDAGARYAASALTQYTLIVVGVVACFRQIGIGWQSVQWLVAAMSVGLGFGLQEIFANFVSGIILLFERPIRVGDTVTIGNVSGTVTRIRIRATTVLDWDNKELIVPNRDFVTGNLVNWTLTNPNIRLVITVGLAFGTDTRLATRLLHEIAVANPLTLTDPEPVVLFSKIGNGNLEFELRVFVSGIVNLRMLRHELHMAINDAFLEHKITVAFPQQDLHVRSVPDAWVHALTYPSTGNVVGGGMATVPPTNAVNTVPAEALMDSPAETFGAQSSAAQSSPPQSRKHVA